MGKSAVIWVPAEFTDETVKAAVTVPALLTICTLLPPALVLKLLPAIVKVVSCELTVTPFWLITGVATVGAVALGACTVMVMLELFAMALEPLSLACAKKVYVPAVVGVPDSAPLAKAMPAGSMPLELQV